MRLVFRDDGPRGEGRPQFNDGDRPGPQREFDGPRGRGQDDGQQRGFARCLPFLDVSSLNLAVPSGTAIFLSRRGERGYPRRPRATGAGGIELGERLIAFQARAAVRQKIQLQAV